MSRYASAEAEREALEAVIREAHGAVKDLRREIKNAAAAERSLREAAREAVDAGLEEVVREGLDEYRTELKAAMDKGVDHVLAEFAKLENTIMHGDKRGRGPRLDEL